MSRGIHRATSDSKRGRQIAADSGRIEVGSGPSAEVAAHNAEVEARRQEKLKRRQLRGKHGKG